MSDSPQGTLRTQRINEASGKVVEAAMSVHSTLGPRLLESVYEVCMQHELEKLGLSSQAQLPLPVHYDNIELNTGLRIDLLVENEIVIELKSVEKLLPIHQAQLLTYLKLAGKPVGLLINFNVCHLKDGIKRIANDF